MTVPAITDQVDDHVLAEAVTVVGRQPGHVNHGLRIFSVDVENRYHEHFGHIGGVAGGAGILGQGGVADLIVDDDVHRPTGPIALQLRHIQGFCHHSLPGEGRIAMQQHRKDRLVAVGCQQILPGPGDAFHHRIHRLQVAGIAHEIEGKRGAVGHFVFGEIADMILDIPGPHQVLGIVAAFKLRKNLFGRLLKDVAQYVEASPVGHSEDDFTTSRFNRPPAQDVQKRDEGFTALQRKTRHAHILFIEKPFKQGCRGELVEDVDPFCRREFSLVLLRFHASLKPAALVRVLKVHVLHADAVAIGLFQPPHDLFQRCRGLFDQTRCGKGAVQVGHVQAKCIQI